MFGAIGALFGAVFSAVVTVVKVVVMTIAAVVKTIVSAVQQVIRQVTKRSGGYSAGWDVFINQQIDWRRALTSQEEAEAERDRLATELDDNDGNGIPDLYDAQVTTPDADFLHLKFPERLLIQNDYCRYLPRGIATLPQPVDIGSKGLVRSEGLTAQGQFVMIKWNALNPPGRLDAPLYECNSMDLFKIGHV